jgi:hypothetical protein
VFEIDGGTDKDGSWYQRLAKVVLDVCVSILGPFVSKFANIKVPQNSEESKYRISRRDKNHLDSTQPRVRAAWTQGSLCAPRVGELFAPEHPSFPRGSLDQWTTKLKLKEDLHEFAKTPSLPPRIGTLTAIDAMEAGGFENTGGFENNDIDSPGVHEMAAAKDEAMKDFLLNKISNALVDGVCAVMVLSPTTNP